MSVVRGVPAVEQGGLRVGTAAEVVQPFQARRQVAPAYIYHILHRRLVVPREERQEQLVVGVDGPIHLGVDVVEVERVVLEVVGEFQEQVHIGAPGAHQERYLVFDDRPFDGGLRGQDADGGPAVETAPVARLSLDVEHGRGGSAILGGQQTLVERGTGQRVVVEGGEETANVADVIDGGIVEEHLVLCRGATAHLEAAAGVALRLHAGQQLDGAHEVVLSEQLGCGRQVLYLQHLRARLHVLDALAGRVGGHDHLVQPLRADGVIFCRGR